MYALISDDCRTVHIVSNHYPYFRLGRQQKRCFPLVTLRHFGARAHFEPDLQPFTNHVHGSFLFRVKKNSKLSSVGRKRNTLIFSSFSTEFFILPGSRETDHKKEYEPQSHCSRSSSQQYLTIVRVCVCICRQTVFLGALLSHSVFLTMYLMNSGCCRNKSIKP
jgi:hypothetical protein